MKISTGLIILVVLTIITISILFFVYFNYEKPEQQLNNKYTNISIAVFNNKNQIQLKLQIYDNNVNVQNITTTQHGFILILVPVNSTLKLISNNSKYYNINYKYYVKALSNKRITFDVFKPGKLNISSSVNLKDRQVTLKLVSKSIFKNPIVCIKWGLHVVWIKSVHNFKVVSNSNYDRCFKINTINKTTTNISFIYSNYDKLDKSDFLSFTFIDEKHNKYKKTIYLM